MQVVLGGLAGTLAKLSTDLSWLSLLPGAATSSDKTTMNGTAAGTRPASAKVSLFYCVSTI